jgi:pSer/pThr/pTyr-binding forkhead associated (FHA) protein
MVLTELSYVSTPRITLSDPSGAKREFELDSERTTIGRHSDNDICLPDKAVSGRHAVIIHLATSVFLEDLDSTNGTQVNGKNVAKHALRDGDEVVIGRSTLRYSGPKTTVDANFEQTMVLSASDIAPPAPSRATKQPQGHAPESARLRVSEGANAGKELQLTKALTTLGQPGVQVAAITRRVDGYYIVHVAGGGKGKKPTVNGEALGGTARKLSIGDQIELAGTRMVFEASAAKEG